MPDPAAAALLQVRDLRVTFDTPRGPLAAVDGVSFDLAAGEILGMVGESGAGKSIALLALLGLVDAPNATVRGSVRLNGRELIGLRARELRTVRGREIAFVFQNPMSALTPVYPIGRQIVEQLRLHTALSAAAAKARAVELLAAVAMPNPAAQFDRYPHQLSGGMRQRAVIAMALSCKPAVLIADEPTTALDVTVQAQILELIRQLRSDLGSAVILVTHDMGVVAEVADRVMVMYAGRVVEHGSASELFDDARHPYTWGLLGSIPPLTGPRPRRLASIPGAPPALANMPPGCAFAPRCACCSAPCIERVPPLAGSGSHAVACVIPADQRAAARRRCTLGMHGGPAS
jgi:peptide/nickel transport system ATP-binding protein